MNTTPEPVSGASGVSGVSGVSQRQQVSADVSGCQRPSAGVSDATNPGPSNGNLDLAVAIEEWIRNSSGSFTVADLDREFNLRSRQEKNRRATILKRYKDKNLIIRDRRVVGRWHISAVEVDFIDLEAADETPFPVRLPLGLDEIVNIPPKAIIVLAGSSNAGKTCLALNLLRMNFDAGTDLLYLMSEMGSSEYRQRVGLFGDPLSAWSQNVKAASLSANFHGAIAEHNRDGITVVDYLEDVDGEYWRIASDIRAVYDALGTGVAVICLQKKAGALHARGGEGTMEKARLYLSLDCLAHQPRSTIAALKIVKTKSYPGENPNGKERHFKIIRGHQIVPLGGWQFCNEKQRAAWVTKYQHDLAKGR